MDHEPSNTGNDLIAIGERAVGADLVQTVDGRELHAFLRVGKDFSNWMKDRIAQYGFAEGVDFVIYANSGENTGRGRRAKEYALTLDMAKELSMVERNDQGKAARRYFIECERRAKAGEGPRPDFDRIIEQQEANRQLTIQGARKASTEIVEAKNQMIGFMQKSLVQQMPNTWAHFLRRCFRAVFDRVAATENQTKQTHAALTKLAVRVDGVIDMANRAVQPGSINWTEWVNVSGVYAMANLNPPRRGLLSQQVQRSLDAFCKSTHRQAHMARMGFGGPPQNVWHVIAVKAWLDQGGRGLIESHIARHSTQQAA